MKKTKKLLSVILTLTVLFIGILPIPQAAAEGSDATLSDICFDNHSVFNFDPNITSYTVELPYRFSKDGNYFPDPTVTATTTDPNATYYVGMDKNEDGSVSYISINVIAADKVTKKTYGLTVKQVGKNQYTNPGFESGATTGWSVSDVNNATMEINNTETYVGANSLYVVGKNTVSYPYQSLSVPSNNGVTWFSSYAVKGNITMRTQDRTSSITSWKYIDDDGNDITNASDRTAQLTSKDENGWQRSMRISTGLTMLQESASSGNVTTNTPLNAYYDEFYLAPLVISEVEVSGQNYVKCGEAATLTYSAKLYNQYGNKGGLENETVTWKVIGNDDVVVTAGENNTCTVTVPAQTETGSFYIEAQVEPTFNTKAAGTSDDYVQYYCQSMAGGRAKINVIPADATSALADIEVNGGGLAEFDPSVTEYTLPVAYKYTKNDFATFDMPEVSATAVDGDATVVITAPESETVSDGDKIYIDVTDASGALNTRYTLTIDTVGGNLFPDGGFETESADMYEAVDYGDLSFEIIDDTTGAGNKVLKANGIGSASGTNPGLFRYKGQVDGKTGIWLSKDKTYINSFMVKLDPSVTVGTTGFRNYVGDASKSGDSKRYTSYNSYVDSDGTTHSSLTLTNEWEQYSGVVGSLDLTANGGQNIDRWVGIHLGSNLYLKGSNVADYENLNIQNRAYFLYDEMYLGELVIAEMSVTDAEGNSEKTLYQSDENATITLSEAHVNQYGNTQGLESETVSWSVLNGYSGVTVDANGVVTVASDAAVGTAVIEATLTPSYSGAAQTAVKKRYKLTILPKNGFVFTKGGAEIEDITDGSITAAFNYTNASEADEEFYFISALYSVNTDSTLTLETVELDSLTVEAGETASKGHTLTVPEESGYKIKSFLWKKGTQQPKFTDGVLD